MDNKYLPSPWQRLTIPRSFSEVIKVDSVRTLIHGPFAVSFEYRDDSILNLERIRPEHADEYALYLEIIMEDKEKLWSWYSNRYHYFLPDHSAYFQDNVLHFVCTTQNESFKHVSFKSLTNREWVDFLGDDLPDSMEERVRLISKKFW
jgi:hypothetical protein